MSDITDAQNISVAPLPEEASGWSWGGSFAFFYLTIAAKNWGLFIASTVLCIIPIVNIIAWIVFFIYGGLKGKSILYTSSRYINHDQKVGAIKALEMVGGATAVIMLSGITFIVLGMGAIWATIFQMYKQEMQQEKIYMQQGQIEMQSKMDSQDSMK